MSTFGDYGSPEVVDAAEKFISKMDERDLAAAIEQSERTMSPQRRPMLIEAIFDAFRARGESSEDAAEAAGISLESLASGDAQAVKALIEYAKSNAGLLKEAATALIEGAPGIVPELAPALSDGITQRLQR